jgi:uncharacterized protein YvpB
VQDAHLGVFIAMLAHLSSPSRRVRPRITRITFGVMMICVAIGIYGFPESIHATTTAIRQKIAVRTSLFSGPIDARAFLFNVPFFHQQHALSCEVASLRSALAGVGVTVSESDLWFRLPKDGTPKRVTANGMIWGDPNTGFVGNVNGRMPKTGYGVFAGPIMRVADQYASSSLIRVDNGHAIDAALAAHHPIIAWTVIGPLPPKFYHWKTPNGASIDTPAYEHTNVIVGYRGTADRIEGVYVIDPLSSLRYESWDEFQARTAPFGHVGIEIGR